MLYDFFNQSGHDVELFSSFLKFYGSSEHFGNLVLMTRLQS